MFNPSFPQKELVCQISAIFEKNHFKLYLVGGAVRSLLLGQDPYDLDFTTDALPEQVQSLFKITIPTGIEHGTVTVLWKKEPFEITTFRHEGSYDNSRHPNSVTYIKSLKEDLSRRDFTMNALAFQATTSRLFDYFGGKRDIENRIIRAIGEPIQRFREDALRILRGCRFASELDFTIERHTRSAMRELSPALVKLSAERIYREFIRTLKSPYPLIGLNMLKEIGFLSLFTGEEVSETPSWWTIPNLPIGQNGFLGRLVLFLLAFSEQAVTQFLEKLKFPNSPKKVALHLIHFHTQNPIDTIQSNREARCYLHTLGREYLALLLSVEKELNSQKIFESFQALLQGNEIHPLTLRELALSGDDLLREGYQGREIGRLLQRALYWVLESPKENEKSKLLGRIRHEKAT